MVTPEFPPTLGGMGIYVYNLSKKIVEKGHEVTVITRGTWKKSCWGYTDGIKLYKVPYVRAYPFHMQLHSVFINKLLKSLEDDFDLINIHVPPSPSISTSSPIVVTIHGFELSYPFQTLDFRTLAQKLFSYFYLKIDRDMMEKAKLIIALSEVEAREIRDIYHVNSTVKIIRNGVDTCLFKVKNLNRALSYIFCAGRLTYMKGLLDLVKAAKIVCREHPKALFVLAGVGPLKHRLETMINQMKLDKNFILAGHVSRSRIVDYYQNATIYVHPSYYEASPTSVIEAMACGIPVVATSAGGIPELVIHGKTGFLVPPKNHKLLGKAILKLLDNDRLREKMAEASRERAQECYSWDTVCDKVLDCYESVAG